MLQPSEHAALAQELLAAEHTREPTTQFSRRFPDMTIDDSYAIQRAWLAAKLRTGRRKIGHKVGLTSRAMQIASQITEPDFGVLLDDMHHVDGVILRAANFLVPRIEVEFAFVLNKPLRGPNVGTQEVMNATEYVSPALELIDARIEQFDRETKAPRKVLDTIADNAASAGIVMGTHRAKPVQVDWRWAGALLYKNGVIEESGLGAAVMEHPANGVAWLANKFAAYGEELAAGEIVLGGSFTRPVACVAGDVFVADYGTLGKIHVWFE